MHFSQFVISKSILGPQSSDFELSTHQIVFLESLLRGERLLELLDGVDPVVLVGVRRGRGHIVVFDARRQLDDAVEVEALQLLIGHEAAEGAQLLELEPGVGPEGGGVEAVKLDAVGGVGVLLAGEEDLEAGEEDPDGDAALGRAHVQDAQLVDAVVQEGQRPPCHLKSFHETITIIFMCNVLMF